MKKITKISITVFAGIVLIFLAGLLFLTSTVGEKYVKGYLEDTLTSQIGTTVQIGLLETNFWSHVRINNVSIYNSQDNDSGKILNIEELYIEYSLLELIKESTKIKLLQIDNVSISMILDSLKRTGIPLVDNQDSLDKNTDNEKGMIRFDSLVINNVQIVFTDTQIPLSIKVSGAEFNAELDKNGKISSQLKLKSISSEYDSIEFDATDTEIQLSLENDIITIDTLVTNVNDLEVAAHGQVDLTDTTTLDLKVTATGALTNLFLNGHAISRSVPEFSGKTRMRGEIKGTLINPAINVASEFTDLLVDEIKIDSVGLQAQYENNNFNLDTFSLSSNFGKISGNANIFMDSMHYSDFNLFLDNIDAKVLWLFSGIDSTVYTGHITGNINSTGKYNDMETWVSSVSIRSDDLEYQNQLLPGIFCSAELRDKRANINLTNGANLIDAEVEWNESKIAGVFSVLLPDISTVALLANQPEISGGVWMDGVFSGTFDDPVVKATLKSSGLSYNYLPCDSLLLNFIYSDRTFSIVDFSGKGRLDSLGLLGQQFDIDSISGAVDYEFNMSGDFPHMNGYIRTSGREVQYNSYTIDSLYIQAELQEDKYIINNASLIYKHVSTMLQGSFDAAEKNGDFEISFTDISIDRDSMTDSISSVNPDLGKIYGQVSIESLSDIHAGIIGKDLNTSLYRLITLDTLFTDGTVDIDFEFSGSLDSPNAVLQTKIRNLQIAEYRIDSLLSQISLMDTNLILDKFTTYALNHALHASGTIGLFRSDDSFPEFTNTSPVELLVTANDLDMSIFEGLFLQTSNISGTASTSLRFFGNLSKPSLNGWMEINNSRLLLEEGAMPLDDISMSLRFADSLIFLDSLKATANLLDIDAAGTILISEFSKAITDVTVNVGEFGVMTVEGSVSDSLINLQIHSDSLNLTFASPFITGIDSLKGILNCRILLDGETKMPSMLGSIKFNDASANIPEYNISFSGGNADIQLERNKITVKSFDCLLNEGLLTLAGYIEHDFEEVTDISMSLKAKDIKYNKPDMYTVAVDSADFQYKKAHENYILEGDVVLKEAKFIAGVRPTSLLPWVLALETVDLEFPDIIDRTRLDVRVRESENIWVDNNLARIRVRTNIGVIGTPNRPNLTGQMQIREGYLLYLDRKFVINEGIVYFNEPARFNPDINLDASTQVKVYRRTVGETYTIFIKVDGLLDQLQYGLYSEPTLEKPDIVALLTLGATRQELTGSNENNGNSGIKTVLQDRLSQITSGRVSNYLSRKVGTLFGFDDFTIQGNLFKNENSPGPQVVASKHLTTKVKLTYSTTVGHLNDQKIRLGYRLTPKLSFQGETDQLGNSGIDFKYGLSFK